jgi:hypothetical protein
MRCDIGSSDGTVNHLPRGKVSEKRLTPALKRCASHSITSSAREQRELRPSLYPWRQMISRFARCCSPLVSFQSEQSEQGMSDFLGLDVRLWPIRNVYQSGRTALPITFCT